VIRLQKLSRPKGNLAPNCELDEELASGRKPSEKKTQTRDVMRMGKAASQCRGAAATRRQSKSERLSLTSWCAMESDGFWRKK